MVNGIILLSSNRVGSVGGGFSFRNRTFDLALSGRRIVYFPMAEDDVDILDKLRECCRLRDFD
jgi:hypothetical protein